MVSLVNSHTNATSIGWHLWEIDLRFAPGLPPGRVGANTSLDSSLPKFARPNQTEKELRLLALRHLCRLIVSHQRLTDLSQKTENSMSVLLIVRRRD